MPSPAAHSGKLPRRNTLKCRSNKRMRNLLLIFKQRETLTASGRHVHREYNYQDGQAESVHRGTQTCQPIHYYGEQHRFHQQSRYLKNVNTLANWPTCATQCLCKPIGKSNLLAISFAPNSKDGQGTCPLCILEEEAAIPAGSTPGSRTWGRTRFRTPGGI